MTNGEIEKPVIEGGNPVRQELLPYGTQKIEQDDIDSVVEVLKGKWLTTGPFVKQFEEDVASFVGKAHCVAFCNGTAALHAACFAAGISQNDEVIVSSLTFVSSANCVKFMGGTPIFADVCEDTLNIDCKHVESLVNEKTKAIIAVDFTGQSCEMQVLRDLATLKNIVLIEDGAHALGSEYCGRPAGAFSAMTMFSFHPVKHITTGEGGCIVTDDDYYAERLRRFRTHGITADANKRETEGTFYYEMVDLGFNYRITDVQCALGSSQLRKLPKWLEIRREIANKYDEFFSKQPLSKLCTPVKVLKECRSAYHLYIIQLNLENLSANRNQIFKALKAEGLGVNVHYLPVYLHPYYQELSYKRGICPNAERAYERIITLPLHHSMSSQDVSDVLTAVSKILTYYQKNDE
eukprot:GCRY01002303.1.p1 GENE.GCRY01002303.1~~GCRY01002303.1.p1  ORF type:complete len:407 (-),score=31.68 GCRY01002303.1:206-1426(-)